MLVLAIGKSEKNCFRFNEPPKYCRKFMKYERGQLFVRLKKPVYKFKSADDEKSCHINAEFQARYDRPRKVIGRLNPIFV
jgi:hypothetical protein